MEIYITGDIHGKQDFEKLQPRFFPQGLSLSGEDVLIIAGDFGLPVLPDNPDGDYYLEDLASRKYTTLFIDGNHERFSLLAGRTGTRRACGSSPPERPHLLQKRPRHRRPLLLRYGGARAWQYGRVRFRLPEIRPSMNSAGLDSLEDRDWMDCVLTHGPGPFLLRLFSRSTTARCRSTWTAFSAG